jgi:hypothetical protein
MHVLVLLPSSHKVCMHYALYSVANCSYSYLTAPFELCIHNPCYDSFTKHERSVSLGLAVAEIACPAALAFAVQ